MSKEITNKEQLVEFVENNIQRKKANSIARRVRLMRKLRLPEWNYFCTFTYDDSIHTEDSFKKKLQNTLKHIVARKSWKYVGVWERSPTNNRLHFHGIFYIPSMIGNLTEQKDYSTKTHKMQVTTVNSLFLKRLAE